MDGQGPLICRGLPPIQTLSAVTGIISAGHKVIYMEGIWPVSTQWEAIIISNKQQTSSQRSQVK